MRPPPPPSAPMGIEARKSPRIPVRLSADVELGGKSVTATTRNLSVGGVCLECEIEPPDGTELRLTLFLVEEDVEDATTPPLSMRGKVAWCAPGEAGSVTTIGIRFDSLTPPQLAALTGFLKATGE